MYKTVLAAAVALATAALSVAAQQPAAPGQRRRAPCRPAGRPSGWRA